MPHKFYRPNIVVKEFILHLHLDMHCYRYLEEMIVGGAIWS